MPGGQSGHPLSPHYADGHAAWAKGEPTPFLPGPARPRADAGARARDGPGFAQEDADEAARHAVAAGARGPARGAEGGAREHGPRRPRLRGRAGVDGRARQASRRGPRGARARRVLKVGTSSEIRALAGKGTDVVELRGRFVAPGFIDAHLHLLGGGWSLEELRLDDAPTFAAVAARVRRVGQAHPDARWVTGEGWTYAAFPGRPALARSSSTRSFPTARPTSSSYDGHTGWANSAALRLAEVTRATQGPAGRRRSCSDASGEPTGALKESAQELVERLLPQAAAARERARAAPRDRAGRGVGPHGRAPGRDLRGGAREPGARARGDAAAARLRRAADGARADARGARAPGRAAPALRDDRGCGSARSRASSTASSRAETAAMFEPYPGGGTGLPLCTQEELDRTVAAYDKAGWQVMLHAIGDRGDRHGAHGVRARRARERHERPAPPGRAHRGAAPRRPAALQGGRRRRLDAGDVPLPEREPPRTCTCRRSARSARGARSRSRPSTTRARSRPSAATGRCSRPRSCAGSRPRSRARRSRARRPGAGSRRSGSRSRRRCGTSRATRPTPSTPRRSAGTLADGHARRLRGAVAGPPRAAARADQGHEGAADRARRPGQLPGAGVLMAAYAGKVVIVTGASQGIGKALVPRARARSGRGSCWPRATRRRSLAVAREAAGARGRDAGGAHRRGRRGLLPRARRARRSSASTASTCWSTTPASACSRASRT